MIDFSAQLNRLKGQWWRRQLLSALGIALGAFAIVLLAATGLTVFFTASIFGFEYEVAVALAALFFVLSLVYKRFSQSYQALSLENVLLHVNRVIPHTEESTHLILCDQQQLNTLQRLQRQRVESAMAKHESVIDDALGELYGIKNRLKYLFLLILITLVVYTLHGITQQHSLSATSDLSRDVELPTGAAPEVTWKVQITPPQYTGQKARQTTQLDIEAPEGSHIQWLATSSQQPNLALRLAQQQPLDFERSAKNQYTVDWLVTASTLYSIDGLSLDNAATPDIYTLSMLRDRKPSIQIEQPLATVSEYLKSERPIVDIQVTVHDDYALTDIYISASIAKGTGEAVKFRDAEFRFDTDTEQKMDASGMYRNLTKRWDFEALDMEPGDELYFSVIAVDNRQPEPQRTQSNTKILKWLDDDEIGITSDGILIDFIPEYFKSQRQIIIETIELIERQPLLTAEEFEQTSRDLALAQSDLKQRYGQYLGDEFESGVMQTMESGPTIPSADEHGEHGDDHDDEHETEQETEHQEKHGHAGHDHAGEPSGEQSLSGYDEVIDQFGHNHGEADVGFILLKQGQLNPKALMKQSLTNMWQAELFLHLADPKNALPYEQKALDYLNRARKAERVYVKRLGFKPPPVTEERRYEGDLSDILEPSLVQDNSLDLRFDEHIQQLLSRLSGLGGFTETVTAKDKELLQYISSGLAAELAVSDDNQQTLNMMSILERISLQQQWQLDECNTCINSLIEYFWQRLPQPIAEPTLPIGKAIEMTSQRVLP